MDLTLTAQETAFRDALRAWIAAKAPRNWEAEHLQSSMHEKFAFQRRWQKIVFEGGWAGVAWPKEYGGRGATLMEQAIFTEEMAHAGAPPLANTLGLAIIGPTIIHFGTDAQKKRYLANILSGDEIWCQGFSEPNAGSDLAGLRTRAERRGDRYVINGQKIWTSYAWVADWCALLTRSDAGSQKHAGLTYILVDMKTPGVEVRPLRQMTGESEFTEVFFRDVDVPAANVLGPAGEGWKVALGTLAHERATLGVLFQVQTRRQLDRLTEIWKAMDARDESPIEPAVVRQKIAQPYVENEVLRLNHLRAISSIMRKGAPGPEGSILKIGWSEANQRFQALAQEILGNYGQLVAGGDLAFDNGSFAYSYLRSPGHTIEAGT
ncbi:MAG TPA: acyl-CoA dehydrogenase family protein, partial [Vicinamibacterales bacterium]|nr:acyl-CoA dehydrogenase family protein [Vicinamibacterales bacterium]